MAVIDVSHAADIRAIMGASGTGKSHYLRAEMRKARRLAVWDLEDEHTSIRAVTLAQLPRLLATGKAIKLRFVPSTDSKRMAVEFDLFCRIVAAAGNLTVVVEELRFVTQASRAPEGWAFITLRGRKRGLVVIGTSQRPAQIDKDFLSNATLIRVGALEYEPDRKAILTTIGNDPLVQTALAKLTGHQALIWTRKTRKVTRAP